MPSKRKILGVEGIIHKDNHNRVDDILPTVPGSTKECAKVLSTEPYDHDDDVIV